MRDDAITLWYCALPGERVPPALQAGLPAEQARQLDAMGECDARQLRLLAWWLRNRLLAESLGVAPQDLQLIRGAHGKPALAGNELAFSLSHAKGCVAVAAGALPLGVDVERKDRQADWPGLARRLFAAPERAALAAQTERDRAVQALRLWSAREAWSKAGGRGIAGFAQDPPFALVDGRWQPSGGRFWQTELPRHVLSLAVPAGTPELRLRAFEIDLQAGPEGWQARRHPRRLRPE